MCTQITSGSLDRTQFHEPVTHNTYVLPTMVPHSLESAREQRTRVRAARSRQHVSFAVRESAWRLKQHVTRGAHNFQWVKTRPRPRPLLLPARNGTRGRRSAYNPLSDVVTAKWPFDNEPPNKLLSRPPAMRWGRPLPPASRTRPIDPPHAQRVHSHSQQPPQMSS